jgi:hypothetical protein
MTITGQPTELTDLQWLALMRIIDGPGDMKLTIGKQFCVVSFGGKTYSIDREGVVHE